MIFQDNEFRHHYSGKLHILQKNRYNVSCYGLISLIIFYTIKLRESI